MIRQEETEFVEQAFQKLRERGWLADQALERSAVTEKEIAAFEARHQVTLPSLYKAYLMSYRIPDGEYIMSITGDPAPNWTYRGGPLWLDLRGAVTMEELENWMELLQVIREFCGLPEESFRYLIPIGDWGAGWGPLCLDLSREGNADPKNTDTWSVVWFDHEDFAWDKTYLRKDGLLHGQPAAPDFKTLLEWYFYGSLEAEFEAATGVKPTYGWYQEFRTREAFL